MSTAYTRQVSPLRRLLTYVLRYRRAFAAGLVCSCLTTAIALDDATVQRVATELTKVTGKNVKLLQRVDPAILGGAIITPAAPASITPRARLRMAAKPGAETPTTTGLLPARLMMRDAIAKSAPANAAALRYSLALEVLRDRSQNIPAAKAVAREVAYQAPANDGNTGGAVNWLLDSAAESVRLKPSSETSAEGVSAVSSKGLSLRNFSISCSSSAVDICSSLMDC